MKKMNRTPLAAAMGAALISTFAAMPANAESNPFAMTEMSSGYMQLAEMKCGASMGMPDMAKPKAAEGACAGSKTATEAGKKADGSCGAVCKENMKNCDAAKTKEGACGEKMKGCGEGMAGCTEMMKSKDGSCGAKMKATEAAPAAAPAPTK